MHPLRAFSFFCSPLSLLLPCVVVGTKTMLTRSATRLASSGSGGQPPADGRGNTYVPAGDASAAGHRLRPTTIPTTPISYSHRRRGPSPDLDPHPKSTRPQSRADKAAPSGHGSTWRSCHKRREGAREPGPCLLRAGQDDATRAGGGGLNGDPGECLGPVSRQAV